MQLKDIKITSLSITGNSDGSEKLYISVAFGEGADEVFHSKYINTKGVVNMEHLELIMKFIAETAGVG